MTDHTEITAIERIRPLIFREYEFYPEAEIQDYIKLLYQASFGMEHILQSTDSYRRYLHHELQQLEPDEKRSLLEPITLSGDIARLNLTAALAAEVSPERIIAMTLESAKTFHPVSSDVFVNRINVLGTILSSSVLGFDAKTVDKYLREYIASGTPAVHHSSIYRLRYFPHYRLINPLFIDKLLLTH